MKVVKKDNEAVVDVAEKKKISSMTDDLVQGALNQKSTIKFDGNVLDIDNVDTNKGAEEIVADQKAAIKAAIKERDLDGTDKKEK